MQDVTFDIDAGDIVGVVGRNGAGKSTLLKVLARITEPTSGHADIRGRIGSLLEVGTGFHQELTGRENVFLSSAILGMNRSEVTRKLDEIVAFSEVEQFLDTPVKHYSSGMYLKLAFAVAAHLEPEILLIDEVLAVGDIAFQRKCLGKMNDISRNGRTVVFVSHNMSAVTELCQRGIFMHDGRATFFDKATEAVQHYITSNQISPEARPLGDGSLLTGPISVGCGGVSIIPAGKPFSVALPIHASKVRNPWVFFIVEDAAGRTVVHNRITTAEIGMSILDGPLELKVDIPPLWLSSGLYSMYFKLLLPVATGEKGRVQSERSMLHISGDLDQSGSALLTPRIDWSLSLATFPSDTETMR